MAVRVVAAAGALLTLLALLAVPAAGAGIATLAVDFGTEWVKMGLVKPGVPMDIVLNRESKRKTANLVTIRKGERTFGLDGLANAIKYPQNGFRYLGRLLGKNVDSSAVQEYRRMFPEHVIEAHPTRGTVVFRIDAETMYTVEELVAMVLQHVVELGSEYAEQPITSVVLSIPPYYNQAARRALLSACDLADINVMRLMSSPVSIGLNFGVFRRKEFGVTERHIVFYDMGSSATTAAVATFFTAKDKESKTTVPHVEIRGLGYDETLGGFDFDLRLRDHLLKLFKEKHGAKLKGDPATNPRALAKLLKEAQRVKTVLSANAETNAQIEGLFEEVDFRTPISRDQLEALCEDLFPRVAQPLLTAVADSGLKMDDIETVIIVGGGVRMPKVQDLLKTANNERDLGKSLNGDEANALGAAFEAASLSKAFRVKKFINRDYNPYSIEVHYDRTMDEGDEGEEGTKRVVREVFPRGNPMPKRKEVVFKRFTDDFHFDVNYGALDAHDVASNFGSLNITSVDVSGVVAALNQHENGTNKVIKAVIELDRSGIVNVTRVYASYEIPPPPKPPSPSIMDKISNLFSDGDSKEEKDKADASAETDSDEDAEAAADEEAGAKSAGDEAADEPESEPVEGAESEQASEPDADSEADTETAEADGEATESAEESAEASGEAGSDDTDTDADSDSKATKAAEKAAEKAAKAAETAAKAAEAAAKKKAEEDSKPRPVKITLDVAEKTLDLPDLDAESMAESKSRLQALLEVERARKEREIAFNQLEAFIFRVQERLTEEDVEKVSTEEEREQLGASLSEAADWMYEEGFEEGTEAFHEKTNALNKTAKAIFYRAREMQERPAAIARLRQSLNLTRTFVSHVRNLTANATEEEPAWITATELDALETLANDTQEWLDSKIKAQEELPLTEQPVLKTSTIGAKASKLDQQTVLLARKPKPKAKTPPKTKTTEEGADTAEAGEGASGTDEPASDTEGESKAPGEGADGDAEEGTPAAADPLEAPTPAAHDADDEEPASEKENKDEL